MSAIRQNHESVNEEANRFLMELEEEFDLMRLRARRATLGQEETRLAEEQESLTTWAHEDGARSEGWWRAVATRVAIWRLEIRRRGIAVEMRRLALLEGDIEFALRLRRRQSGP